MTQGSVHDLQALVNVTFLLPHKPKLSIGFVVDTGFAGALTLPPEAVAAYLQEMVANLANDNNVKADVHIATILWNDQPAQVALLALGRRPLLGTALLKDTELVARFQEGGSVTITELA